MKSLAGLIVLSLTIVCCLFLAPANAMSLEQSGSAAVVSEIDLSRFEAYVDGSVERSMIDTKMPGLVFSAARSDKTFYLKGYGWSHPENRLAADPDDHPFFIGSITKVFTAVGILQLWEKVLLRLDDDATQHIDSSLYDARLGSVTIRHLMTHTAGFEERMTNYYGEIPNTDGLTDAEVLRKIKPQQIREPGTLIGYSNYSWIILGQIIESVSGLSYNDYIEEKILNPLGMRKSGMMPESPEQKALFKAVRSHSWRGGAYREIQIVPQHPVAAPSGLIRSTASDMARFARMILNAGELEGVRILTPDAHAKLFEVMAENAPETAGRTAGFWTYTIGDHRIFAHTGQHEDFRSHLMIIPSLDLALFVSNNSPAGSALGLPRQIVEHFFGDTPLAVPEENIRPINPKRYSGSYLGTRGTDSRFERLFWSLWSEVQVSASEDSVLIGGMRYMPIAQDLFQSPHTGEYVRFFGPDGETATHYSKGFATYQVYRRVGYLRSGASIRQPVTATLILSLIILIATPFQLLDRVQASNRRAIGLPTEWLLRVSALTAIVSILAFGSAMQNYGGDASASTRAFPNATFSISIWAAIAFTAITLLSLVACVFDFKNGRGAFFGRLIRMAVVLVFAVTTVSLFYWNFIPDPLFS
ncbi:MAG: serine hydrolase domain-containing protein [Pseudomonadota bacterium]